jgi:hypothetical protein
MACLTVSFSSPLHFFKLFSDVSRNPVVWSQHVNSTEYMISLRTTLEIFLHTCVLWRKRICVGTLIVDTERLTSPSPLGHHFLAFYAVQ